MMFDSHSWKWVSDTHMECRNCGKSVRVENLEGYSKEDAPEYMRSAEYRKEKRAKIGLEKFYGQKFGYL